MSLAPLLTAPFAVQLHLLPGRIVHTVFFGH
jgi:hypothetical protein